jgi:hypothetical protein
MDVTSAPTDKLGSTLSETWTLLDRLLKKITLAASKPMDQHSHPSIPQNDAFSRGEIGSLEADKASARHPFFGCLRHDDFQRRQIKNAAKGDLVHAFILNMAQVSYLPCCYFLRSEIAWSYRHSEYILGMCHLYK